ncbi:Phosphatidylinositol 3,5-bisphosphate-binding protein [Orbilia oligospora]|uniref:Phosphatidylinositol 3,5-bisphosphate-binding protein n=1 Tax=Orbilia oligospora TaxID=2813651 RepID=A0A7C8NC59_ORBOL|nr:Phosphatidylinositol 3,5-bisphosphate-binding protein [Orbilia oligospora]KAF3107126.1 Phosphatidylinositol 3,5-bisphosphate-binding protein [Orbilia oligospora]KAF3108453.1 Phosphatidylinositol 3,5-bisphosphate-binding protein [Orbilia oligospora]KAF3119020.1 Phosphatidylinositol 3,5-bisphosphate-binding protein [Orbilia oligospora]KAF3131677.1 Phosphatidylinositol 3,5-bisphosphate-binding protein [Orbilia oligospora]
MNTRKALTIPGRITALSANYNQDQSCFAVGLEDGFAVMNSDPCELRIHRRFDGGVAIAIMLGRSNFLALVGGGRDPKFPPNKVVIWDDAKQRVVITLEFKSDVLGVRLSRSRIVVVLRNHISIYTFSSPPQRLQAFETVHNDFGLTCLGSKHVAFPGRTIGQVNLFDLQTGNNTIVPAHTSAIMALALSPNGDLLATASENGTLIRIFSTASSAIVTELRRGIDKAMVYSMAFSPSSNRIAVTSDKGTLHIFDVFSQPPAAAAASASNPITEQQRPSSRSAETAGMGPTEANKRFSLLGKLPLLPKYFNSEWSFTQAKVEGIGKNSLGWTDEDTIIVTSTEDCKWEKFVILNAPNTESGKACEREAWRNFVEGVDIPFSR